MDCFIPWIYNANQSIALLGLGMHAIWTRSRTMMAVYLIPQTRQKAPATTRQYGLQAPGRESPQQLVKVYLVFTQ